MSDYVFKPVQINRGGTSYSAGAFNSGTSVTIDSTIITTKWKNSILQINKPLSTANQTVAYNAGENFTAAGVTITLSSTTWNANVKPGDVIVISSTEYTILALPTTSTATVTPAPPASGTLTVYKGTVTWMLNMKRISEMITISGFLVDDNIAHAGISGPKTAEQKVLDVYAIVGATSNTAGVFNLVIRENAFLPGRYFSQVYCTDLSITDSAATSEPTYSVSSAQRVRKFKIDMTLIRGINKV